MSGKRRDIQVRNTLPQDLAAIIDMCRQIYPDSPPWTETQLGSHLRVFPEGQFVAVERVSSRVIGSASSLIVLWDDYDMTMSWRDFTDHGMFTNHDPARGRTLYGAEVMAHPSAQGQGVGTALYQARRDLTRRLGLLRIRAGARLRGYHLHADRMSAEDYAIRVARGEIWDPTVSFQIRRGFHILAVVSGYLRHDRESLGHAAVIEWLNPEVARPEDWAACDPRFNPPAPPKSTSRPADS